MRKSSGRFLIGTLAFLVTCVTLAGGPAAGQTLRDGQRFDQGVQMSARSETAPKALDALAFYYGQWDVKLEVFDDDTLTYTSTGLADVTYMNRGHAFMERFHCSDFDGNDTELNTIAFLVYNPANSLWVMSVANSYTENIAMYNGDFAGEGLVLNNAVRRLGGARLTLYEVKFTKIGKNSFDIVYAESTDDGTTWQRTAVRAYTRRPVSSDFMAPSSTYGSHAPNLPEAARQFDFLIGQWHEAHAMTFPNGQTINFPSDGTAVHALNGHAIMEYSWYEVDPRLPDAATTIVRLYNRAMRRWECMYMANRFNGILHFGGVAEGDRIVLHSFDANTSDVPISYWVFHSMSVDTYQWYAETSNDRGKTFEKTWIIEAARK